MYKGTLRMLLVLLHDFPEFLCKYHFQLCDVIPSSCIQMRNLMLSAFPRNMRLPDPFTPNLKVDLLPEISESPRIVVDFNSSLLGLQVPLNTYLSMRQPANFLSELPQKLLLPQAEALGAGTRYSVPLINALVLYIGMNAIHKGQAIPMEMFRELVMDLDAEGRYLLLNAIANQLRYPNSHTHYFSCVLLFLFAESSVEIVKEQITRVLLERLIVNRPHPWGLLITFIELIKNPRYQFWSHGFTHCAPEVERLFENVARSCIGQQKQEDTEKKTAIAP
jgi:CCR4-NOT transcription complex subunit 1